MNASERKRRLKALGYQVSRCTRDFLGRACAYKISPNGDGQTGSTNYVGSMWEVELFIERVEKVREWQQEAIAAMGETS